LELVLAVCDLIIIVIWSRERWHLRLRWGRGKRNMVCKNKSSGTSGSLKIIKEVGDSASRINKSVNGLLCI